MKKIIYSCLILATTLFVGCTPEQDEIFDESAAQRIESNIKDIVETLEGSPNGWQMDLFTGTFGTNVMVKFADGKVTASDYLVHDADEQSESLYSVIQNGGPVLTFNTFNEIFHAYSDPIEPGASYGNNEGLGADFEFVVLSYSQDEIILRGLKHRRLCRLVRQPETTTWAETLGAYQTMQSNIGAPMYEFYYNGELVPGTSSLSGNSLVSNRTEAITGDDVTEGDATEKLVSFSRPIVPTMEGFRTETPFSYTSDDPNPTIQHFKYDAESLRFVCTDEGVDMYIVKVYPPANVAFENVTDFYYFNLDFAAENAYANDMSNAFVQLFLTMQTNDCSPYGELIHRAFMGYNPDPSKYKADFLLVYQTSTSSGGYTSIFGYSVDAVPDTDDQVKFSNITEANSNAGYYPGGKAIGKALVDYSPWTISYDNEVSPNEYTFVSTKDASYSFKISK
ncbi:MAG TPA: DUF4302 domain-containing protein [Bacteroidaceae bacterium]|nr:DUF4302 domain-containing protein [Bacteroidaceae bacterium]